MTICLVKVDGFHSLNTAAICMEIVKWDAIDAAVASSVAPMAATSMNNTRLRWDPLQCLVAATDRSEA